MTSRVWYWVASGLIVPGVAIVVLGFSLLSAKVEHMPRVVMPGQARIFLSGGRTTLYVETRSIVDGKAYRSPKSLSFTCKVIDHAGKVVPFEPSASSDSYSIGGYAGQSAFDIRIDGPEPLYIDLDSEMYVLDCEGASSFVMAIGQGGVGKFIPLILVGAVLTGLGGTLFVVVLVRRVRQKRRAAAGR